MVVSTHGRDMSAREFLLRRLSRIVPIYWIASLITLGMMVAFPVLKTGEVKTTLDHFVASLAFLTSFDQQNFFPVLPVGWSLNFEMAFYVMFAASLYVASRFVDSSVMNSTAWPLALMILGCQVYPSGLPGSGFAKNSLMLLFLVGALFGWCHVRKLLPKTRMLGVLFLVGGVTLILMSSARGFLGWGIGSALIVWGILCFDRDLSAHKRLQHWGDCSYSTYLLHLLVLWPINMFYVTLWQNGNAVMQWGLILVSVLTIGLISQVSFTRLEVPLTRWCNNTLRSVFSKATQVAKG